MSNSYCKKDHNKESKCSRKYSNRVTKNEEEYSYGKFYFLVSKMWKIVFYIVIRREKTPGLCYFRSAKN